MPGLFFGHETIAAAVQELLDRDKPPRRLPENPPTQPSLDPVMVDGLRRIERRISRKLRWHWMTSTRCWSIQMFDPKKNDWAPLAVVHHEDALDPFGRPAFKVPDERDLIKFCEGFLEIKYNSGDVDEDWQRSQEDKKTWIDQQERAESEQLDRVLDMMLTQTDIARTEKVKQHLAYHGSDAGFKEVFQVPRRFGDK